MTYFRSSDLIHILFQLLYHFMNFIIAIALKHRLKTKATPPYVLWTPYLLFLSMMLVLQLHSFFPTPLFSSFPLVLVCFHHQSNMFQCNLLHSHSLSPDSPPSTTILLNFLQMKLLGNHLQSLFLASHFFLVLYSSALALGKVIMTFTWRNPMVSFLISFYLTS